MKKTALLLCSLFLLSNFHLLSQQVPEGELNQIAIPQHIQLLNEKIKYAEDTEDWNSYYNLRAQIINEWNNIDPQIAALYKTTNKMENNGVYPQAPQVAIGDNQPFPNTGMLWGNDFRIHAGTANDISLVSARGDTIYASALRRNSGSSADTIYIYSSPDGGLNWNLFLKFFITLPDEAVKVELLDFWGSSGPSYLLMFTLYSDGVLWCTRITPAGSTSNNKVVDGGCTDFSVDRNYPGSNYRCFVLYDSSGALYSKRSDPASYATVWQDRANFGTNEDGDLAYGYTGSIYAVFNGASTGNLYVKHNYNYADPTGWVNQKTIENGSTDTTFNAEIIATREDTSAQQIAIVYTHNYVGTTNLKTARKQPGVTWSAPYNWVSNASLQFKHSNLYSRKVNGNNIFQGIFNRSNPGNVTPRYVMYKPYDGSSWVGSIIVSDSSISPTGSQNPVVIELPGDVAAFLYAGSNGKYVYFDRQDWATGVNEINLASPDNYYLNQNYPNPFNPITKISWQSPVGSHQLLKVFDVLGNEVATLVDEYKEAGNYEVDFNAASLSSGVYFYQLNAGDYVKTMKMVLLK
jgi:hypothetical protein